MNWINIVLLLGAFSLIRGCIKRKNHPPKTLAVKSTGTHLVSHLLGAHVKTPTMVHLKLIQGYKSTILQLKKKKERGVPVVAQWVKNTTLSL